MRVRQERNVGDRAVYDTDIVIAVTIGDKVYNQTLVMFSAPFDGQWLASIASEINEVAATQDEAESKLLQSLGIGTSDVDDNGNTSVRWVADFLKR